MGGEYLVEDDDESGILRLTIEVHGEDGITDRDSLSVQIDEGEEAYEDVEMSGGVRSR